MDLLFQYRDLATPKLKAIIFQLEPSQRRAMLARLGKQLEVLLKAHFALRESEPSHATRQGWAKQHWWAREVRAKTAFREADDKRAIVGIDSRQFAHRANGGTIRPGPGKRALAIPLRGEAYGVLPRSGIIPGLFPVRSKVLGKAWLAAREDGALRFYYRLVPSVTQEADPRALPPVADMQAALEARAQKEIERVVRQYPA